MEKLRNYDMINLISLEVQSFIGHVLSCDEQNQIEFQHNKQ